MTESVSDVAQHDNEPQPSSSNYSAYLHPSRVVANLNVASRKRLLEQFAELITSVFEIDPDKTIENQSTDGPSLEKIFDTLHNRERLGSTGLGKGVALPHGRIEALREPVIAIAKLENAIDYDSPDGLPVWLVVCLLVPSEANEIHLNLLAALATKFDDENFVRHAKEVESAKELYNLFSVI